MSVTISRLRHHGLPGLQADQWVSTAKQMPSAMETGTSFKKVSPTTSKTESSSFNIELA